MGGFGNHLRWLILLSPEFKIKVKGLDDKDFITKSLICPKNKTYSNWIYSEWKTRVELDQYLDFNHNIENLYDPSVPNKIIIMTTRPKYALKHYMKFNPLMNDNTIRSFMRQIKRDNESNTTLRVNQEDKTLVIDSNKLYNSVLDKELYKSITNFFEIGNVYEKANEVHKLWYDLNQKAIIDLSRLANTWEYTPNIEKPNSDIYEKIVQTTLNLYKA